MGRRRSLEEKLGAVEQLEAGESGRRVASELGINWSQVHRWHRAWKARGEEGLQAGQLRAAQPSRGAETNAATAEEARFRPSPATVAAAERPVSPTEDSHYP